MPLNYPPRGHINRSNDLHYNKTPIKFVLCLLMIGEFSLIQKE